MGSKDEAEAMVPGNSMVCGQDWNVGQGGDSSRVERRCHTADLSDSSAPSPCPCAHRLGPSQSLSENIFINSLQPIFYVLYNFHYGIFL